MERLGRIHSRHWLCQYWEWAQAIQMSHSAKNVSVTVNCDTCLRFISCSSSFLHVTFWLLTHKLFFFVAGGGGEGGSLFMLSTHLSTLQDSHRFGAQISKALKDVMRILSADTKTSLSSKGKKLLWERPNTSPAWTKWATFTARPSR